MAALCRALETWGRPHNGSDLVLVIAMSTNKRYCPCSGRQRTFGLTKNDTSNSNKATKRPPCHSAPYSRGIPQPHPPDASVSRDDADRRTSHTPTSLVDDSHPRSSPVIQPMLIPTPYNATSVDQPPLAPNAHSPIREQSRHSRPTTELRAFPEANTLSSNSTDDLLRAQLQLVN
ncbi:hypothetical protein C4D60_Mb08t04400 [Musa balbisiana]|uniref:Uncharacterized protein n=1 Tax=Musa balbisiana TaxID=52838 RepID=A0A4S8K195_MUSBA|nr:hypothetical protein C4D60_Mb08t04400 [Musa balbisiana]